MYVHKIDNVLDDLFLIFIEKQIPMRSIRWEQERQDFGYYKIEQTVYNNCESYFSNCSHFYKIFFSAIFEFEEFQWDISMYEHTLRISIGKITRPNTSISNKYWNTILDERYHSKVNSVLARKEANTRAKLFFLRPRTSKIRRLDRVL